MMGEKLALQVDKEKLPYRGLNGWILGSIYAVGSQVQILKIYPEMEKPKYFVKLSSCNTAQFQVCVAE